MAKVDMADLEQRMQCVCEVDWEYKSERGQAVLDVLDEALRFRDQCSLFCTALKNMNLRFEKDMKIKPSRFMSETSWQLCLDRRMNDVVKLLEPFVTFSEPVEKAARALWARLRGWHGDERVFGVGVVLYQMAPYLQIPRAMISNVEKKFEEAMDGEPVCLVRKMCEEACTARLTNGQLIIWSLEALDRASTRAEKAAAVVCLVGQMLRQMNPPQEDPLLVSLIGLFNHLAGGQQEGPSQKP